MTSSLDASYAYCKELSKRTAGNFYFSFLTLPTERFRAMCVLYAFMRITDDLGDDLSKSLEEREAELAHWRDSLTRAVEGAVDSHAVFPALHDVVARYRIPPQYLFDIVDGVRMDLNTVKFETFESLADYCYHVAGAVGLCCIHVWGFHGDRAIPAAVSCGRAFQLTNILRDLKEDAAMGRLYLPQEDLDRFGYTWQDLKQDCRDARFERLMQFEVARTRVFYAEARELFDCLEPAGRGIFEVMLKIYGGILDEIERRHYDVFSNRVQLSRWRKLCFTAQGIVRQQWLNISGNKLGLWKC